MISCQLDAWLPIFGVSVFAVSAVWAQSGAASATRDLSGFSPDQLADRPICDDHDEACWQRNRRIHVVPLAQAQ
jgi:hypothetical protein